MDFSILRDPVTFVEAVLQHDRQRLDYCAEIYGKVVHRAERAADLERGTAKILRRGAGLRWERAVVIERAEQRRHYSRAIAREGMMAGVDVAIARGEVAKRDDGAVLFRGWPPDELDDDLPVGLEPEDNRIVSLLDPRQGSEVIWRPYSEAVWRALGTAALAVARIGLALENAESVDEIRRAADLRAFFNHQTQLNAKPTPAEHWPWNWLPEGV